MENVTQPMSVFALLQKQNELTRQASKKGILDETESVIVDTLQLFTGSIQGLNNGMRVMNSYLEEELDKMEGQRVATRVDVVKQQLTEIGSLVALGATPEEAVALAYSYYRR